MTEHRQEKAPVVSGGQTGNSVFRHLWKALGSLSLSLLSSIADFRNGRKSQPFDPELSREVDWCISRLQGPRFWLPTYRKWFTKHKAKLESEIPKGR